MFKYEYICDKAYKYIKKYKSHDPRTIAEASGIHIYIRDLGSLEGMYAVICRRRCIFVNSSLDRHIQNVIIAHELGHAVLHEDIINLKKIICDDKKVMYDKGSELEANCFAAALLINKDRFEEMLIDGISMNEIATNFNVPLPLVETYLKYCFDSDLEVRSWNLSTDNSWMGRLLES